MIHNGVNKKKKSIHSHLNYDRHWQLQVYKNINDLMTWNIIWQVSRSIFGLHRVMSLGCRLRVRGCRLLPASQSLLVIVGSQVTLVSGNRSSWKYSNYTCKLKFTLDFFKYRYIHMCSEELLRYNVHSAYEWNLFIKVYAYTLWSKISFFSWASVIASQHIWIQCRLYLS